MSPRPPPLSLYPACDCYCLHSVVRGNGGKTNTRSANPKQRVDQLSCQGSNARPAYSPGPGTRLPEGENHAPGPLFVPGGPILLSLLKPHVKKNRQEKRSAARKIGAEFQGRSKKKSPLNLRNWSESLLGGGRGPVGLLKFRPLRNPFPVVHHAPKGSVGRGRSSE